VREVIYLGKGLRDASVGEHDKRLLEFNSSGG